MPKQKQSYPAKRWCFTINNWTEEQFEEVKNVFTTSAAYGVVGKEKGDSGTLHLQGYLRLKVKLRFNQVQDLFKCSNPHLEGARGTEVEASTYCKKDGDFFELGKCRGEQGKRTDLSRIAEDIMSGSRINDVAEDNPSTYIRYSRGMGALRQVYLSKQSRSQKTITITLIGEPGCGKSRWAYNMCKDLYGMQDTYYKPRGEWWDGYDAHKAVIIDDFYGWLKYDELLKIADRYPYRVPVKGGFAEFTAQLLIITSNNPIEQWYKFEGYTTRAIDRRVELSASVPDITKEQVLEVLNQAGHYIIKREPEDPEVINLISSDEENEADPSTQDTILDQQDIDDVSLLNLSFDESDILSDNDLLESCFSDISVQKKRKHFVIESDSE